jgi:hypothetical protein
VVVGDFVVEVLQDHGVGPCLGRSWRDSCESSKSSVGHDAERRKKMREGCSIGVFPPIE